MSMTAPQVSRMTVMRVRRIGRVCADMALAPGSHDLGRTQQLRADRQVVRSGGLEIDAQSNPVVLSEQPDDHAAGRRTIAIGDGENAAALERPQTPVEMSELGGGNERSEERRVGREGRWRGAEVGGEE